MNLEEKDEKIQELGELLRPYKHLTQFNIASNDLRDISECQHLTHLLSLKASGN